MAKKTKKRDSNWLNFEIELGECVCELITGFKGIVTSRTQYLTGSNRYGVQPIALKDGIPQDPVWFDEETLDICPLNEDPTVN